MSWTLPRLGVWILAASLGGSMAQAGGDKSASSWAIATQMALSPDDFQLGFRIGPAWPITWPWSQGLVETMADIQWRPYRKAVWVETSPTTLVQYREDRFGLGLGGAIQYPVVGLLGIRSAAGLAYSFGDYRGSSSSAASEWKPWWDGGFVFGHGFPLQAALLYQWHPLPGVTPHRLALELGIKIP